ncbi:hypothetical protein [Polymorphospora sp. NPDC050346]|uniref:hypothetical protein n=1 Tax=Polymorphospora sp. NPDC050346 TaxID=3155780 RepID=UPI0033FCA7AB
MTASGPRTRPRDARTNRRPGAGLPRYLRPHHSPLSPSTLVDIGWHTFLLYTREYAAFCDRIAGGFIHHEPEDGTEWPAVPVHEPVEARRITITAMRAAGYHVDLPLWNMKADCTQCHQGCHDSPAR